jgi:hypothetical protein
VMITMIRERNHLKSQAQLTYSYVSTHRAIFGTLDIQFSMLGDPEMYSGSSRTQLTP